MQSDLLQHDDFLHRLNDLQQKIQYVEKREEENNRELQRQLSLAQESLRSGEASVASLDARLSKDLVFTEETLTKEIESELLKRQDMEKKLRQMIASEVVAVRSAIDRQEQRREEEYKARTMELTQAMSDLCSVVEDKVQSLEADIRKISARCREDVQVVDEKLKEHRSIRETAEMNLLQLVEDCCGQLQMSLEEERQQRMESHKRLERLVLEASNRQWTKA